MWLENSLLNGFIISGKTIQKNNGNKCENFLMGNNVDIKFCLKVKNAQYSKF